MSNRYSHLPKPEIKFGEWSDSSSDSTEESQEDQKSMNMNLEDNLIDYYYKPSNPHKIPLEFSPEIAVEANLSSKEHQTSIDININESLFSSDYNDDSELAVDNDPLSHISEFIKTENNEIIPVEEEVKLVTHKVNYNVSDSEEDFSENLEKSLLKTIKNSHIKNESSDSDQSYEEDNEGYVPQVPPPPLIERDFHDDQYLSTLSQSQTNEPAKIHCSGHDHVAELNNISQNNPKNIVESFEKDEDSSSMSAENERLKSGYSEEEEIIYIEEALELPSDFDKNFENDLLDSWNEEEDDLFSTIENSKNNSTIESKSEIINKTCIEKCKDEDINEFNDQNLQKDDSSQKQQKNIVPDIKSKYSLENSRTKDSSIENNNYIYKPNKKEIERKMTTEKEISSNRDNIKKKNYDPIKKNSVSEASKNESDELNETPGETIMPVESKSIEKSKLENISQVSSDNENFMATDKFKNLPPLIEVPMPAISYPEVKDINDMTIDLTKTPPPLPKPIDPPIEMGLATRIREILEAAIDSDIEEFAEPQMPDDCPIVDDEPEIRLSRFGRNKFFPLEGIPTTPPEDPPLNLYEFICDSQWSKSDSVFFSGIISVEGLRNVNLPINGEYNLRIQIEEPSGNNLGNFYEFPLKKSENTPGKYKANGRKIIALFPEKKCSNLVFEVRNRNRMILKTRFPLFTMIPAKAGKRRLGLHADKIPMDCDLHSSIAAFLKKEKNPYLGVELAIASQRDSKRMRAAPDFCIMPLEAVDTVITFRKYLKTLSSNPERASALSLLRYILNSEKELFAFSEKMKREKPANFSSFIEMLGNSVTSMSQQSPFDTSELEIIHYSPFLYDYS